MSNLCQKNAGALEITDSNDYYPFGMNHLKTGNAFFGRGSYKDNKYNGKELQETGMYSYGWRDYMPDIVRWNGIDQLAEAYSSTSTYAYVANNPVLMTDPDGRWMDDTGHITDTTGQTFGFLGSSYKPQGATNYLGVKYGDGGGNGSYTPFGRTQAYADLMTAFYNGGTGGMSNIGGTLRWWTDYEDPDPTVTGVGALGILKLKGYSDNIDFGKTTSSATWWVNTAVSTTSTANLPRTGFFKYNELWHQTKTRGVSFAWQNKWKNPGAKFWRGQQVKGFQGARSLGTKLTAAGGVLLVADVAMSGQVKASTYINGIMLGASTTGVGSIVAGAWFIIDMGTGGINYLNGNGFKTLSDVIDESSVGQSVSFEMYDGLY